jgi:ferredoxin
MDFETKYNAKDAQSFEQKNEMFKRVRWEPELKELARSYYGIVTPQVTPGFRHEEIAFRNAGWGLEMGFARGVVEKNFGLYSWEDNTQGVNELPEGLKFDSKDPEYNTRLVKKAAKLYGADMVGVSKLDRRWIYTKGFHLVKRTEYEIHIPDEYAYVISMAVAMDYEYYKYTPTFIAGADTGIPTGNDTAMSVPYAIQAGLGELGRNNILITPEFGPRVRLCKIFTDFPLVSDKPIEFGVTQFCEACKKCAKHCPPQAIPHGSRSVEPVNKSNAGGTLKWYSDLEKCFKFWAKNACDCGNCIRVCPFNKPHGVIHDMTRWFIERFPSLDSLLVKADDMFGYGKQADIEAFWDKSD